MYYFIKNALQKFPMRHSKVSNCFSKNQLVEQNIILLGNELKALQNVSFLPLSFNLKSPDSICY